MTINNIKETSGWKKRFFTIWFGQAISQLGSRLVGFAFIWYLTSTTGSATVLSIATLMSLLPDVIISPFAGVLVDRWNRKTVLIVFDALTALVTLLLALLFSFTTVQLWMIYLVMFLRSSFGTFQWTAMMTTTSLIVPDSQLARVSGLNQTLAGALGILAPAFGAFLLGILPMQGILFIDVSTALLAVIPLILFQLPQPVRSDAVDNSQGKFNMGKELVAGFKFVGTLPGLLTIILTAMLINFILTPAFSLLPLLVTEYYHKGVLDLGLAQSLFSIGFILGGLILSIWGGFKNRIVTSMVFLVVMGFATAFLGFLPSSAFYGFIAVLAVTGASNPLVNGPMMAAFQTKVAPDKQGRVFSLINAGASLVSPIGLAIAGPLSDALGVQIWFIIGGSICVIVAFINILNRKVLSLGESAEKVVPSVPVTD